MNLAITYVNLFSLDFGSNDKPKIMNDGVLQHKKRSNLEVGGDI